VVGMGALPRPALPDGALRLLFDELHELHHRAGWPSLRDMSRDVGCSHTTVSAAFSEPRLPRWGLLELIVETLGGDTEQFHGLWLAASRPGPAAPAVPAVGAQPGPVPRDLPADVVGFTGRDAEVAELDRLLDGAGELGACLAALSGTAGVGKTALAVHWARRVAAQFPDGQLYLDLRGYDPDRPVQPAEALESFLRELGVDGAAVPQDVAARAARYRTLLAGRRMLVLLDNAHSVEQVAGLLPGDPSCFVLVTSRDALPALVARYGARRINLDLLPPDAAVALLHTLLGPRVDAEAAAAAALTERCAFLPLALRIVAELAQSRAGEPLADLVAEFDDVSSRLDLLQAGDDEYTAVRAVFSWSLRQLSPAAATAFRLLGLHPGADLDLYAAAALFGADLRPTRRLLDTLVRAHLVDPGVRGRYGMHDLLRAYAIELAAELDEQRRHAARARLFDHYVQAAASAAGRADGVAWLDAERANLIAIALAAADELPSCTAALAEALAGYLDAHAHYADALVVDERALAAARATGDRAAEATALNLLGGVYRRLGRYRESQPLYEEALRIHRELGGRAGEALAQHGLGIVAWRSGRYTDAQERLGRALRIFVDCGDRLGEGRVLYVLGVVELKLGRHDAAVSCLQRAVQLNREIGERTGEGRALNNLGEVHQRFGRLADAERAYAASLEIARQQGNRAGEGVALVNLADVARRRGRLDEALTGYGQALAICREVGYRIGQADALRGVGMTYCLLGRHDEGIEHLQMAIDIAQQMGEADVETGAWNDLGEALSAAGGRGGEAADAYGRALLLADRTGDGYEQKRAHAGLGGPR
jgi:tetratricopeptide (TPR) repeat protein